jgi:D-tagatose-1,6-bisphosphate aldolase subunit GatZ/KbaZ
MAKARELVRSCVLAGYTKIHLDASMRCADDPGDPGSHLDERIATDRTVELCRAAEEAHAELPEGSAEPVYVIGTEVPIPGGEQADRAEVSVTRVADVDRMLGLAEDAFSRAGLLAAWERVIAVVVQPGVEFGDDAVHDYDRDRARELSGYLAARSAHVDPRRNGRLVYEAHSTDHQTAASLRAMVEDHFAILKVGPWLTFSMREALFALESIERELFAGRDDVTLSRLREVLDATMVAHPEHWRPYLRGDERELRLARAYGYSDRCRYYWPRPELREAVARLMGNLSERPIPPTLLSQFLPGEYEAVRAGTLAGRPADLVRHRILATIDLYASACGMR